MNASLTVIIIDDHSILREGLRGALSPQAGLQVVAEASSAVSAYPMVARLQPDIVVLDISLPDINGLEAIREVMRRARLCRIVMLTAHANEAYAARALEEGAGAYVLKEDPIEELLRAIQCVMRGEKYLPPRFVRSEDSAPAIEDFESPLERLTRREREVFKLVVRGFSTDGIARQLGVGLRTVESHRTRINKKLDAHGAGDLVRIAARSGDTGDLDPQLEAPPSLRPIISRLRNPPRKSS